MGVTLLSKDGDCTYCLCVMFYYVLERNVCMCVHVHRHCECSDFVIGGGVIVTFSKEG